MIPEKLIGGSNSDSRGLLRFNNSFDLSNVKRMYVIENTDTKFVRGWQGHCIEQRWFSVIQGSFKIDLIAIDNWLNPSKKLQSEVLTYV